MAAFVRRERLMSTLIYLIVVAGTLLATWLVGSL
jgi:hypothetical protein